MTSVLSSADVSIFHPISAIFDALWYNDKTWILKHISKFSWLLLIIFIALVNMAPFVLMSTRPVTSDILKMTQI